MTTTASAARPALRKTFGDEVVLGIDLEIAEGTIFVLRGPNSAGKTTTVQILSTLLRADDGEVEVAGFDLEREAEERSPEWSTISPPRHAPPAGDRGTAGS